MAIRLSKTHVDKALRDVAGVPTSRATADYARRCGIPLLELDDAPRLDLAIDGADAAEAEFAVVLRR